MKQVLTIAGSDSGGGAGIQADIKAMSANGVFAMSAITAVTAQNTEEVTDVFELPLSIVAAQIDAVFDDFDVSAVKTGMLSSAEIVKVVAKLLKPQNVTNLVVDPVMIAKSGHRLLKPDAVEALMHELFRWRSWSRRTFMKRNSCRGSRLRLSMTLARRPRSFTVSDADTC